MSAYVPTVLRQLVHERAVGRCEYCLIPDDVVLVPHEVDHVIALKHGGLTESHNLAPVRLLQINAPERIEERRLLILSGAWAISAID